VWVSKGIAVATNDKWTVLLSTGDKGIQEVVSASMEGHAGEVIQVEDARSFFEELHNNAVDLIIFDPQIPALSGADIFRIAKSYHPDIPAVLIIEDEDYSVTSSLLNMKVICRMLKPIDGKQLQKLFNKLRGRS